MPLGPVRALSVADRGDGAIPHNVIRISETSRHRGCSPASGTYAQTVDGGIQPTRDLVCDPPGNRSSQEIANGERLECNAESPPSLKRGSAMLEYDLRACGQVPAEP